MLSIDNLSPGRCILPPELLSKIIVHCVSPPTLQNLAARTEVLTPLTLVATSWTYFAQQDLFRVFTIKSSEDAKSLLEKAGLFPEFKTRVRGLWIIGPGGFERTPADEFRLAEIFKAFTEVKNLWVDRLRDFDVNWILGLPGEESLADSILDSYEPRLLTSLCFASTGLSELSVHDSRFKAEDDFNPVALFPFLRHLSFSEGPSAWMLPLFTPTLLPSLRTFDMRFGGDFLRHATPYSSFDELLSRLDLVVAKLEEGVRDGLILHERSPSVLWGAWPTSFLRIGEFSPRIDLDADALADLKVQHLRLETYSPKDDEAGLQVLLEKLNQDVLGLRGLKSLYIPISYRFGDFWDPLVEICEKRRVEFVHEEFDFAEMPKRKSEVPEDYQARIGRD